MSPETPKSNEVVWPLGEPGNSPPFIRGPQQPQRGDVNRDLKAEKKRAREKAKAARKSRKKNRNAGKGR
jgi:hypothetical protein